MEAIRRQATRFVGPCFGRMSVEHRFQLASGQIKGTLGQRLANVSRLFDRNRRKVLFAREPVVLARDVSQLQHLQDQLGEAGNVLHQEKADPLQDRLLQVSTVTGAGRGPSNI
jgi:hypothetical protein